MRVFSEFKAKHHFEIEDLKIYSLETPQDATLDQKRDACLKMAFEFYKAIEEEKLKAQELKDKKEAEEKAEEVTEKECECVKECDCQEKPKETAAHKYP